MIKRKTIILVVDDDPAVCDALKFSLELDGFEVHVCKSGEELLDHAVLNVCGCIVLDYKMPAMNGLEVLDKLAAANTAAPVIFITGPIAKGVRERALGKGAAVVMEKPLFDRNLSKKIHELTA
jgi:two-component system, LuxR family, response regulator FixJ